MELKFVGSRELNYDFCTYDCLRKWAENRRNAEITKSMKNRYAWKGGIKMNHGELKETIISQINLLTEWNMKHIDKEPEQVRKNIETILKHLFVDFSDFS